MRRCNGCDRSIHGRVQKILQRSRVFARSSAAVLALWLFSGVAVGQERPQRAQTDLLPKATQERLQRRESVLRAMSPTQRQSFERRVAQWHALSESERRQRRERWQAWQDLPSAEQAQLQAAATRFNALPIKEQKELRSRYADLDASQRRGWLLGPALGTHWQQLQPLLMQIPAAQRTQLLTTLHALSPQQRAALAVLAQRTPPQDRDRLRRALLAQPDASRGTWLLEQLDR